MKTLRRAAPLLILLSAACAAWRWSGGRGPTPAEAAPAAEVALSSAPAARPPVRVVVPPTPKERLEIAEFYSDLGPDAIDVSAYPAQQRYNYEVYARTCARCHTLARSNNAPIVGRGWWEFYVAGMRVRSRWQGEPLSPAEVKAILDFLDYDSRVRKTEHSREFEAQTDELKRRFDAAISEKLRRYQRGPALLPRERR